MPPPMESTWRAMSCRTVLRAFKDHVLDEMRDAIPLRILIARPALNPNPNRDRADVLHLFGDDGQPVG